MDAILLAREADRGGWIRDRVFKNAYLRGPAVIGLGPGNVFLKNTFHGDIESIAFELPNWEIMQGVVGISGVTFEDCIFSFVTMCGSGEDFEAFRSKLKPRQQELPSQPQRAEKEVVGAET